MASRYQIVCMVVDCGSLKGAADELGYTQSAVSQAVKALERELGTTIIERGKQGVSLTRDGKQYLPYLRQIVTAEAELEGKRQELLGLSSTDIRIATFTNVSRTVLPRVIRDFGALHQAFTLRSSRAITRATPSGCTMAWLTFALRRVDLPRARETRGLSRRAGGAVASRPSTGGKGKGDACRPGVRTVCAAG